MSSLSQSNEVTIEGPLLDSSALSFRGGVHIGPRALNVLNLIWFGNITRLSLSQIISTCRHPVVIIHGTATKRSITQRWVTKRNCY
jgi:hypothetical protein